MTDLTLPTAGARLAVTDVGEGDPIVALHAAVADRRVWESCTRMWMAAGHRVVTYDQRGFGSTESDGVPYRPVDDLWTVMDDRELPGAVLVGNSKGGRVAIDAALEQPARVAALVVIGPAVGGAPDGEPDASIEEIWEQYEAADESENAEEINRIEAHFWLDGPTQTEGRVGGPTRDLFLDMNGRALELDEGAGEAEWGDDAWDRLSEIGVPTLVVVGEYDGEFVIDRSRKIAEVVPEGELVVIPDSAHLPPLDAPGVLATLVTEFLS